MRRGMRHLLNKYMAMDITDGDVLKATVTSWRGKEKELHDLGDYKTAKNMG